MEYLCKRLADMKLPAIVDTNSGEETLLARKIGFVNFAHLTRDRILSEKDWEALGLKVELTAIPAGVFFSSDAANPDTSAKFFADVQEYGSGYSDPDPEVFLGAYTTEEIKTRAATWRGRNYNRYSNPEYDGLYNQLTKEVDLVKRQALVIKMNDLLIKEVVVIPIAAFLRPVSAKAKELKGPIANAWEGDLWNIADWSK